MGEESKEPFAFADDLKDAAKFCATFARAKMADVFSRRMIPAPQEPTATVSFIENDGKVFAVTAEHVVRAFKAAAKKENVDLEGYICPAGQGQIIGPPFISTTRIFVVCTS